jgi:hypothetical protein
MKIKKVLFLLNLPANKKVDDKGVNIHYVYGTHWQFMDVYRKYKQCALMF